MNIWLLGPGAAGKSSTGAALAQRLGLAFSDLDAQFIATEGAPGHCIARHGYASYAAAIRARFALYRGLPLPRITTMRPLAESVEELVRRIA